MAETGENFGEHDATDIPTNPHLQQKQGQNDDLVEGVGEKRWPGWPGESAFRILVQAQKVGGIIGRKGEFIKKMCEETRARIKILDGPPGTPERAVLISAKEEPDTAVPPAVDGLLRVHSRIVDGLDGDLAHAPPGFTVSTRLLVHATQAGSLIGKQGTTIKSIQEASNTMVRVLGTDDVPLFAMQDDRVVEIQGEPTGVHKALELVANHLRKFLVDRSVIGLFEMHMQNSQMEQNMPPSQSWGPPQGLPPNAGPAPGFGANPQYMPPHQGPPQRRPHDNYYPPTDQIRQHDNYYPPADQMRQQDNYYPPADQMRQQDNYYPPTDQMRQQDNYYPPADHPPLDKQPHQGLSMYGRDAPVGIHSSNNAQPPPQIITQVTQHMQIPLSYADAVIGTAGANISYIRRASGATVTVQETRGVPGEMTVEINGTASQVQASQQLIQNFMAEAAGAPQNPVGGVSDPNYNPPYTAQNAMYSSPSTNTGHAGQTAGGYGSAYGTNYGY